MPEEIKCAEALPAGRDATELDWIQQAQADLGRAMPLLLNPTVQNLNQSTPLLEAAVCCMEKVEHSIRNSDGSRSPAVGEALSKLKREIHRVKALLEHTAIFYGGWARMLYVAACGYTAAGEAAQPQPVGRVSVEA